MFAKIHFFALQFLFVVLSMSYVVFGAPLPHTNEIQERAGASGPFSGGKATFFFQGGAAGACGKKHKDSDLIVALDAAKFKKSSCGKKVKITNTKNKKTVTATVADECPGCANSNSLDLSKAAFTKIATVAEGEVSIKWSFV